MTTYTSFGSRPQVTVAVSEVSILNDTPKVEINWACCGSVPLEDAKRFYSAFGSAIGFAEEAQNRLSGVVMTPLEEARKAMAHRYSTVDMEINFARYEALRRLNPQQYVGLVARTLNGQTFDSLVDELVEKFWKESEAIRKGES